MSPITEPPVHTEPTPGSIYHLVAADRLPLDFPYSPDGYDAEGFIHLSTGAQVAGTLDRHYVGMPRSDMAAVEVDVADDAALRWETPLDRPDAEPYPHLYRRLNAADVVAIVPAEAWPMP